MWGFVLAPFSTVCWYESVEQLQRCIAPCHLCAFIYAKKGNQRYWDKGKWRGWHSRFTSDFHIPFSSSDLWKILGRRCQEKRCSERKTPLLRLGDGAVKGRVAPCLLTGRTAQWSVRPWQLAGLPSKAQFVSTQHSAKKKITAAVAVHLAGHRGQRNTYFCEVDVGQGRAAIRTEDRRGVGLLSCSAVVAEKKVVLWTKLSKKSLFLFQHLCAPKDPPALLPTLIDGCFNI